RDSTKIYCGYHVRPAFGRPGIPRFHFVIAGDASRRSEPVAHYGILHELLYKTIQLYIIVYITQLRRLPCSIAYLNSWSGAARAGPINAGSIENSCGSSNGVSSTNWPGCCMTGWIIYVVNKEE